MKRILVAEDESAVAQLLKDNLKNTYEIDIAYDGAQIDSRLNQHNYDLVLLDLNMPDFNPPEFLRELFAREPGIKVIIVSGSIDRSYTEDYPNVQGIITKPFRREILKDMIKQTLNQA